MCEFSSAYYIIFLVQFWNLCKVICFVSSLFVTMIVEILKSISFVNTLDFSCDWVKSLVSSPVFISYILFALQKPFSGKSLLVACLKQSRVKLISHWNSLLFVVNWLQRLHSLILFVIDLTQRFEIILIVAKNNLRFIGSFVCFLVSEFVS
jgi:hypothetical protein